MIHDWSDFGLYIPEILLPREGIDHKKWSVIACDQHTSEMKYWEEVKKEVGDSFSTLNIMLPEIFLNSKDENERIEKINKTMDSYIKNGVFKNYGKGCVFVERTINNVKRYGLVIAVDLEKYDFNKKSKTLIRPTEMTVIERIPPRLRVRKNAKIELPHIVILIDDPHKKVIEPLIDKKGEIVYDVDLMLNGGNVKGKFIKEEDLDSVKEALSSLFDEAVQKYDKDNVIFQAMGDGNHSLATAKTNWENIKKTLSKDKIKDHPARYALCEIENIYDEGITFKSIHRVVFDKNKDQKNLLNNIIKELKEQNGDAYILNDDCNIKNKKVYKIPYIMKDESNILIVENPSTNLVVSTLQNAIDAVIKENNNIKVDYIHGDDSVKKLSSEDGNIGFLLPAMNKFDLFPIIAMDGSLPRKTFSIGEANEKRYYMEAKYIVEK